MPVSYFECQTYRIKISWKEGREYRWGFNKFKLILPVIITKYED